MELQRGDFEKTRDHWWWRPGWGVGTRFLTFHLTFEDASELHVAAEDIARELDTLPAVDVVPIPWLHLTMTGVDHAHAVTPETLSALIERVFAKAVELDSTPLVFDRLFVYREGICLSADTPPWLAELKRIQVEAVRDVCGIRQEDSSFIPHVSLAYFSGDVDLPRLISVVDAERRHPIVVARPRLSLLELERDDAVYRWRVVAQQAIGR